MMKPTAEERAAALSYNPYTRDAIDVRVVLAANVVGMLNEAYKEGRHEGLEEAAKLIEGGAGLELTRFVERRSMAVCVRELADKCR